MAKVILAVQGPKDAERLIVLKRLRRELANQADFAAMFKQESQIAVELHHPNIVTTFEAGFDGRYHYMAMEYLEGEVFESIRQRSEKLALIDAVKGGPQRALTLSMQLKVLIDVLRGLHYAHELRSADGAPLNLVHRDVSPHNVMVTFEGEVKLLDFGIAKTTAAHHRTQTGVYKGKVAYMPLEQFQSGKIDRRADVFAVGVILWQALAGRKLWDGLSDIEVLSRVASGIIPSPSGVNPQVPEFLERVCLKALATDPAARFQTADDFRLVLEQYLASQGETLESLQAALAERVSALFADKRSAIRKAIDERRYRRQEPSEAEFPPPTPTLSPVAPAPLVQPWPKWVAAAVFILGVAAVTLLATR